MSKGAEMVERLIRAHSVRLVPGLSDAQRVEAAGEANTAEARLVEYIEGLERKGRAPRAGGLPARVLEALEGGPLRLTDLAAKVGQPLNATGDVVVRLECKGRVVRLSRGVWALPGQTLDTLAGEAQNDLPRKVVAFLRERGGAVRTCEILDHLGAEVSRGYLAVILGRLKRMGEIKHLWRGVWEIA